MMAPAQPLTLDELNPPISPQVQRETIVNALVLLVMPQDRRLSLLACLENCGLPVLPVEECKAATRILETNPSVKIVLTEAALPDGSWTDLTAPAGCQDRKAELIICMRVADPKLWIDALEHGAYDVLVEPYHGDEVMRIVKAAAAKAAKNDDQPWAAREHRPALYSK